MQKQTQTSLAALISSEGTQFAVSQESASAARLPKRLAMKVPLQQAGHLSFPPAAHRLGGR